MGVNEMYLSAGKIARDRVAPGKAGVRLSEFLSSPPCIREMQVRSGLPFRILAAPVVPGRCCRIGMSHHLLHRGNIGSRVKHLGSKRALPN